LILSQVNKSIITSSSKIIVPETVYYCNQNGTDLTGWDSKIVSRQNYHPHCIEA